jgi:hypothetical protein
VNLRNAEGAPDERPDRLQHHRPWEPSTAPRQSSATGLQVAIGGVRASLDAWEAQLSAEEFDVLLDVVGMMIARAVVRRHLADEHADADAA